MSEEQNIQEMSRVLVKLETLRESDGEKIERLERKLDETLEKISNLNTELATFKAKVSLGSGLLAAAISTAINFLSKAWM